MNRIRSLLCAMSGPLTIAILVTSVAAAAEPVKAWGFSRQQLRPFWLSRTMYGASVLFSGMHDRPRQTRTAGIGVSPRAWL